MAINSWTSIEKKAKALLITKCVTVKDKCVIDKIYPYAKDPYEAKYQFLINKCEKVELDRFSDSKAFNKYSNDMQDVYKNIEGYNPWKKRKILIVFDDMITNMISNKKLNTM